MCNDGGPAGAFEAASVKVNVSHGPLSRAIANGRLTYLNITLGEFIETAYGVRRYQVAAPEWITKVSSSDRYDIVAKAASRVSDDEVRAMLAPLLAERFHLAVRRQTRVVPIYALTVTKGGPKRLMPSDGEPGIYLNGTGGLRYQNYSMSTLALWLSGVPGVTRPVVDRTGIRGSYTFAADLLGVPAGLSAAEAKDAETRLDGVETRVFTTLQEQLGLKLESDQAPVEFVVVDHADKIPTPD